MSSDYAHADFSSSAPRAFQSLFQSPNWLMNVVWLTVAALTNGLIIGQIMLLGWAAEMLALRTGRAGRRAPDIETSRFGDYLSQGLWPFLVLFLVQAVLAAAMAVPIALTAIGGAVLGENAAWLLVVLVPMLLVLGVLLNLISLPILIRALLTQDFMASFDLDWCRDFVRRMFGELIVQGILFAILSILLNFLGTLVLCLGVFATMGIVSGAGMHLIAQFYESYLHRGGIPVPSKLAESFVDAQVV
jgi:hypothetical protein